ncbi:MULTISPECIES: periplasmic nitrate reductase, NapE protein [Marinobacter]|uniref:Periplasmic nitrate reductase, NapE protein n=1 Tax=Marinobacter xiaoshiensis TaxID=3073652 RepID=A0ABU2HE65_9GAMM|nr:MULTISPECIES: periplasmic nitrate reductase, NapE protein [unclassified Marinobacter]MBK1873484.1 periplasmic nitrate reductase, NapE protein [Marinobacter sp. 1-3A]MBK1885296.1 periplasmic nitrate reductase, NapE protein [Marinobacter sp. DY40_1A1]MDS1309317.1 periplasmic nitrate reductase, NapE protein [Marinobacter sp. F60267]
MGDQPVTSATTDEDGAPITKAREWRALLMVTFVILPATSVAVVGGYGFAVWIGQMFFGPPGHP